MARVSLILPYRPGCSPSAARIDGLRLGLEAQGHSVDVVSVIDGPTREISGGAPAPSSRVIRSRGAGLAQAAVEGIDGADGDFLVVLDPEIGVSSEDLGRLIAPLIGDRADLAVANLVVSSGLRGLPARGLGRVARLVSGTSAPTSGLIAVSRPSVLAARSTYAPRGSLYALELLVRTGGRRVDVPMRGAGRPRPTRLTFDEVRHLKHLSDARFGNASRLAQFCLVGASGMVVDLTCYALFQVVFSRTSLVGLRAPFIGGPLDLAAAGAVAIVLALTWNFSLNRRLTFSDARGGSLFRQYVTYALSNAVGIALSFSLRVMLPGRIGFFARHRLAAAVVGIVGATGISFSMSRWVVFGRRSAHRGSRRPAAEPAEVDPPSPARPAAGARDRPRACDRSLARSE